MAVVSAQAYESSIINALAVSDPQMNTALGTPIRKIITAVANEMAAYNVDVNVTTTLYSIESVSGIELDYLVGQFGFTRQEASAARGTVSIYRDNGDSALQIPYGTYVYKPATSSLDSIAFQTTAYYEMSEGVLSGDIAVVAVEPGSMGNVPARTITYFGSVTDYMYVTNENPTSGGRDAETDEQLRQRFLLTVFRNVAGTKDQLVGLALANSRVSKANLIAQESRYSEVVQAVAVYTGSELESYSEFADTSEIDGWSGIIAHVSQDKWNLDVDHCLDVDRRYWVRLTETEELLEHGDYKVLRDGKTVAFRGRQSSMLIGPVQMDSIFYLGENNIIAGSVRCVDLADENSRVVPDDGRHYSVDYEDGTIQVLDPPHDNATWDVSFSYDFVGEGRFVSLEFDYLSKHNRGLFKSVDLYIDCLAPRTVTDIQYIDLDKVITEENRSNWRRSDGSKPQKMAVYIPLAYQPMIGSAGYISMGTSYVLSEGIHYEMIWDVTGNKGSCRGMDAIELLGVVSGEGVTRVFQFINDPSIGYIKDDTPISIPYNYDYPVEEMQGLVDEQRIVTMDVQVHEAVHRYFVIYLSLMFSTFPRDSIIESVQSNVLSWSRQLPFGHTVQLSDIETVAANTSGVDNVRTATESDAGNAKSDYPYSDGTRPGAFGILEVQRDGFTCINQFTNDFRLAENEVFEIQEVIVYSRTQQRWGA